MVHRRALGPDRPGFLSGLADWVAARLGHFPRDPGLFERALTHGSSGGDDYQRLEFLGDRVLGLIVADLLYTRFPDEAEGKLSHRFNALVAGRTCADIARALGVPERLRLGKQARDDGARDSDNVLGDVMESLIGAIYRDGGIDAARSFVHAQWEPLLARETEAPRHPKSLLQEWCAAARRAVPSYSVVRREGPAHATRFTVAVTVGGLDPVEASGPSKQAAETAAAQAFLERYA